MSRRGSVKKQPNGTYRAMVDVAPLGAPRDQKSKRVRTRGEGWEWITQMLGEVKVS